MHARPFVPPPDRRFARRAVLVPSAWPRRRRGGRTRPWRRPWLLQPRQPGVDFDRPTGDEPAATSIKQEKLDGVSALVVRAADGRILRAFADSQRRSGRRPLELFQGRHRGLPGDRRRRRRRQGRPVAVAQRREAAAGASIRDGDGKLDAWKVISAEEATAEIVTAPGESGSASLRPPPADQGRTGGCRLHRTSGWRNSTARDRGRPGRLCRKLADTQKRVGPRGQLDEHAHAPAARRAARPAPPASTATSWPTTMSWPGRRWRQRRAGDHGVARPLRRCLAADRRPAAGRRRRSAGRDGRASSRRPASRPSVAPPAGLPTRSSGPLLATLRELEGQDGRGRPRRPPTARRPIRSPSSRRSSTAAAGDRELLDPAARGDGSGLRAGGPAARRAGGARATRQGLHRRPGTRGLRRLPADPGPLCGQHGGSRRRSAEAPGRLVREPDDSLSRNTPQAAEAAEALLQLAFRDEFEGRDAEAIARYGADCGGVSRTRRRPARRPARCGGWRASGKPLAAGRHDRRRQAGLGRVPQGAAGADPLLVDRLRALQGRPGPDPRTPRASTGPSGSPASGWRSTATARSS